MAVSGVAFADNLKNDVVATGSGTITAGGSTTINYYIQPTGSQGGGGNTCDASDGSPVTVGIQAPSSVVVSSTDGTFNATSKTIQFSSCDLQKPVTFSSTVAGNYSITHTTSDAVGDYNTSPANFSLIVNASGTPADTTKPTGSVSIDNGADWTNSATGAVSVDLAATDNVGIVKYRLANSLAGLDAGTVTEVTISTATTPLSVNDRPFALDGTEGSSKEVWVRYYDAAGNSFEVYDTIGWDKTAPVIADHGPTTPSNDAGWYNDDVVNTFELTESGSGPDSACATAFPSGSQTKITSGEGTDVTVMSDGCTDLAGNTASAVSSAEFKVDKTAPVIADHGPTTPSNDAGWYNDDVVNTFELTESGSGPDSACATAFPSGSQTKITSGEGTDVNVMSDGCTDLAGNTASAVSSEDFKVDKTAPTVAVTGISAGAQYFLGQTPTPACQTTDGLSDVKTSASLNSTGGPLGLITATCSGAEDNAGNTTSPVLASYSVVYRWTGFFQPIDNAVDQSGATPAATATGWNKAKAGSAIPVKFSLAGDQGLSIFETGYPAAKRITCPNGTLIADTVEETVAATTSGLKYDALADQYNYTWKTSTVFAGTCQRLQVKLADGTSHYAFFNFVK